MLHFTQECERISVDMFKMYCLIWVKFRYKGTAHVTELFLASQKIGARQAVIEITFTLVDCVTKDTSMKLYVPRLGIHYLHYCNTKIRRFRFFGVLTIHYQSLYPQFYLTFTTFVSQVQQLFPLSQVIFVCTVILCTVTSRNLCRMILFNGGKISKGLQFICGNHLVSCMFVPSIVYSAQLTTFIGIINTNQQTYA